MRADLGMLLWAAPTRMWGSALRMGSTPTGFLGQRCWIAPTNSPLVDMQNCQEDYDLARFFTYGARAPRRSPSPPRILEVEKYSGLTSLAMAPARIYSPERTLEVSTAASMLPMSIV